MQTKLNTLKTAYAAGDIKAALRIAARFPDLGDHAADITRAHEALSNPSNLHEQMGKDRNALIEAGVNALRARYDLGAPGGFDTGKADTDETILDRKQIDHMASVIAGTTLGRSATKAAAVRRLQNYAEQNGLDHAVRAALGARNEQAAFIIFDEALVALKQTDFATQETDMPKTPKKAKTPKPTKAAKEAPAKAPETAKDSGDAQPHLTTEEIRTGFLKAGKGHYVLDVRGFTYDALKRDGLWVISIDGRVNDGMENFSKAIRTAEAAFKAATR
jgi:hypothetical protein